MILLVGSSQDSGGLFILDILLSSCSYNKEQKWIWPSNAFKERKKKVNKEHCIREKLCDSIVTEI